jgi:hypothetical protein
MEAEESYIVVGSIIRQQPVKVNQEDFMHATVHKLVKLLWFVRVH